MTQSSSKNHDETLRKLALKLASEDGEKWQELLDEIMNSKNPVNVMEEFLDRAEPAKLLKASRTAELPAIPQFTITDEALRATFAGAISNNFLKNFIGKKEPPVPNQKLVAYSIVRMATDVPLLHELGGREKVVITFSQMVELTKRQLDGEEGFLDITGWANIFYIKDKAEKLWSVSNRYFPDSKWKINTDPIGDPRGWRGEYLVIAP